MWRSLFVWHHRFRHASKHFSSFLSSPAFFLLKPEKKRRKPARRNKLRIIQAFKFSGILDFTTRRRVLTVASRWEVVKAYQTFVKCYFLHRNFIAHRDAVDPDSCVLDFPFPIPSIEAAHKFLSDFFFVAVAEKVNLCFWCSWNVFFSALSVLTVDVSRWTKSYKLSVMMLTVQCVCFFLIRWVFVLVHWCPNGFSRKLPSKKMWKPRKFQ